MASKTTQTKTQSTALEKRRGAAMKAAQNAIAEMKTNTGEFDYEQMMFDIMEATTLDDILSSQVVHLKDIIGTPITITSANLNDSEYDDSFIPAYAVLQVEFDDGNTAVVTTGATQVVAALVKAHAAGWFPFRCSTSMATTSAGYDVIRLVKAPE